MTCTFCNMHSAEDGETMCASCLQHCDEEGITCDACGSGSRLIRFGDSVICVSCQDELERKIANA
jgi:hypothetical protein